MPLKSADETHPKTLVNAKAHAVCNCNNETNQPNLTNA